MVDPDGVAAVGEQRKSAGKNSLPISAPEPKVLLPVKPPYHSAVGCKASQARLAVAQADLMDEQAKTTAALGRERDSVLQVARGGSVVRRIVRAAKWFAIGAATGAVAVILKQ